MSLLFSSPFALMALGPSAALGAALDTPESIRAAIEAAEPGDLIEIAAGTYAFDAALRTRGAGSEEAPITLTSAPGARAVLSFDGAEGIVVFHADWIVRGLRIEGCADGRCQAGIHIKPSADRILIEDNVLIDWTQHIKSSRTTEPDGSVQDGRIVANEFFNATPFVGRGSTPIDIVGGDRWIVARNYIHDYGGSDSGNYGIFLKGVTRDGVIEQNLVVGYTAPEFRVGASVGISFGGGGTGARFVPDGDISCEDIDGIARNNIVAFTTDAGLHTKRACGSAFLHNTVFAVGQGIQIQIDGAGEPVSIRRNIIDGMIRGGSNWTETENKLDASDALFSSAYLDPSAYDFALADGAEGAIFGVARIDKALNDYCGAARDADATAYGAVASRGSCAVWPWESRGEAPAPDAGPQDAGGSGDDAGTAMDASSPDATHPDVGTMADASGAPDAGTPDGGAPNEPEGESDDGGCAASPSPRSPAGGALAFCMLALATLRSRRARR